MSRARIRTWRAAPVLGAVGPPGLSDYWSFVFLRLEHRLATAERPTPSHLNGHQTSTSKIKDRTGVIDVIAHDPKTGEVVLVMNEPDEWDSSDEQLLALQERFNAYVSFLLDGELAADHPGLAGKEVRIELRCAQVADTRSIG